MKKLRKLWCNLYSEESFDEFYSKLKNFKKANRNRLLKISNEKLWYKNSVAYAAYVNLFAGNFIKLTQKLDYLNRLGVNLIWLLPILDSPGLDEGFDVKNYEKINPKYTLNDDKNFDKFILESRKRDIHIIFDIPLNHCSNKHPIFLEASCCINSKFHDYFIWSKDKNKYDKTRIIMKGLSTSNWEYNDNTNEYYFHRFFPFQPDWNYKNHKVLEMFVFILANWKLRGVSGFRLDAIPYLAKKENTNCENLYENHKIIRLLRASLDYISPDNFFLAEACQPLKEVIKYFGNEDECQSAYNFPLMLQFYKSMALENPKFIRNTIISTNINNLKTCFWMNFLRVHDELSLEMANKEECSLIFNTFCKKNEWNFREGLGISARLYDLFDGNIDRILLSFSIILSFPGIPLIFYGDEIGMENDFEYYLKRKKETCNDDTRYLCRGNFDWDSIQNKNNPRYKISNKILSSLIFMIKKRKLITYINDGNITFPKINDEINEKGLMIHTVTNGNNSFLFFHNLAKKSRTIDLNEININKEYIDLFNEKKLDTTSDIVIKPYGFYWFKSI